MTRLAAPAATVVGSVAVMVMVMMPRSFAASADEGIAWVIST
jgi:hypothetical protein